ncbi:MAG: flagellar basal body-associated FliL family protein [Phycisphaerales bacterium]
MAEAEKKQEPKAEKKDAPKAETPAKTDGAAKAPAKIGMLTYIIMLVVVLVLAGGGFFLGRILAGSSQQPQTTEEGVKDEKPAAKEEKKSGHGAKKEEKKSGHGAKEEKEVKAPVISSANDTWYFNEIESVVVNPDEPGATRYVRVGLALEFGGDFGVDEATELITSKKPLLINWLNLYFKSLTLSQMQNDRDIKRILVQICDAFNEILFPDQKPKIRKILIREFNIQ